ncbi:MAG: TIGR04255 family protein [Sciscionella sp.]
MEMEAYPPVTEVILSIAFESQQCLVGPQLLMTLRDLTAQYSQVEERSPYEMPQEFPTENQLIRPAGPTFRIIGPSAVPQQRYWLTDPSNDSILLQVQSNYLAINWRKTKNSSVYPGFKELLASFKKIFKNMQNSAIGNGGAELKIQQAEISYINIIRPDALWSTHKDIAKVLKVTSPVLTDVEQLNMAYTKPLRDSSGDFVGRLRSAVETGYATRQEDIPINEVVYADLVPIINITTSVRSTMFGQPDIDSALGFFDHAHDEAGKSFHSLASEAALENWGLK